MTEKQIDALLRRQDQDDRRIQWLLRVMVVATLALLMLAWMGPIVP